MLRGLGWSSGSASGIAVIQIDGSAQNQIVQVWGANQTCGEEEVERVRDAVAGASVLMLQLEAPVEVSLKDGKEPPRAHGLPWWCSTLPLLRRRGLPAGLLRPLRLHHAQRDGGAGAGGVCDLGCRLGTPGGRGVDEAWRQGGGDQDGRAWGLLLGGRRERASASFSGEGGGYGCSGRCFQCWVGGGFGRGSHTSGGGAVGCGCWGGGCHAYRSTGCHADGGMRWRGCCEECEAEAPVAFTTAWDRWYSVFTPHMLECLRWN